MANTIVENKKALFDFIIEEQIEAGISLKGWEVKSLRDNRGHIKESVFDRRTFFTITERKFK